MNEIEMLRKQRDTLADAWLELLEAMPYNRYDAQPICDAKRKAIKMLQELGENVSNPRD